MTRFPLVVEAAGVLLLVAMAAVTEASTKTIFTATTFKENPRGVSGSESDCAQRFSDEYDLGDCVLHITDEIAKKPRGHEQDCCEALKNLGEECMCPGIKMMLDRSVWAFVDRDSVGQIISMSQNLPTTCNLSSQTCQVTTQAVWF